MHVLSTHDRNVDFLYQHNELKNTDIFIHLIANPYNSVTSFFNRWPESGYEKNKNDVLSSLSNNNIKKLDELAEMSVPELMDISEKITENEASALIMEARKPWFD